MATAPPRPSFHDNPADSPVLRVVWMAENGVNEQPLNSLVSSLANLGSAGQSTWFDSEVTRDRNQNDLLYSALEGLRRSTNELTRLLVEVLEVENKQHHESFTFRFGQCIDEEKLRRLDSEIAAALAGLEIAPAEQHWDLLRNIRMRIGDWHDEAIPAVYSELRHRLLDNPDTYDISISDFLRNQIATQQLASISHLERSARSKLEHIRNASGEVGAKSLAHGFAEQTEKEAKRATLWTVAVVLAVSLGIALPAFALTTEKVAFSTSVDTTTGTIIKVIIGLPIFALAAYFARIASQHRETERYLRILTTQVNTVQAYADVLGQPERGQLIYSLGIRAFADPAFKTVENGKVTAIPDEVIKLWKKTIRLTESDK